VLTGVIYGAIVVVWAAYLVPLALRRHDEASRTRSIARFSSAMRVLARRGDERVAVAVAGRGSRVVLTPKAKGSGPIAPTPSPAPAAATVLVTSRRNRVAERAAAARRRQILSILVGLTTVVVLLSLVGLTPWWSVLVPLMLIVAFLAVARVSVRRASRSHWTVEAPGHQQSGSVVVRPSPAARIDAMRAAGPADDEPAGEEFDEDEGEPTISISVTGREGIGATGTAAGEGSVSASAAETPSTGSIWDPLPVTLPRYVGAPVAARTFRTIELGEPGTWTSGHTANPTDENVVAQATPEATAGSTALPADLDDDESDEVAKAVNA